MQEGAAGSKCKQPTTTALSNSSIPNNPNKLNKRNLEDGNCKEMITREQVPVHSEKRNTIHGIWLEAKQQAIRAFMPKGYPDSVTADFFHFAKWQFLHNVAGAVTGVLSTQSLLYGLGLGAQSIPLAAALNWIIKDGLGQLGGVAYAAFISDRFDSEPKRHRFQATVAMQLASILELITPLWPHMFLLIASISNIGKNIAWLASSATRAQMHRTFALRNNLGDITGKSGSQGTAAGLIGTGIGILLSAAITALSTPTICATGIEIAGSPSLSVLYIFTAFVPFSILNIYANYQSNLYVTSSTLNVPRAEMILYDIFSKTPKNELFNPEIKSISSLIPTPRNISSRETFVRPYHSLFKIPIVIEPSLHHYHSPTYNKNLFWALEQKGFCHNEEYFILYVPKHHNLGRKKISWGSIKLPISQQHVALWFSQKAQPKDLIKGFAHACIVRYKLEVDLKMPSESDCVLKIINSTHPWVDELTEGLFTDLVRKNWDIEYLYLAEKEDGRLYVER
ncbi:hypothetical protein G9A89_010023 [Geosiphon pyriformis]|nr:hypothetical protein G9A89_010023 [Geosiphon pyriformis]